MSNRRRERGRAWDDSGAHPISWFAALMRGIAEGNSPLVDRAQAELEQLGYFVVPFPPRGEGTDR